MSETDGTPDMVAEVTPLPEEEALEPNWPLLSGRQKMRFQAPPGVETPQNREGFAWHDRTEFTVSEAQADRLRRLPGFTVVAAVDAPEPTRNP